jgi:DNA polymerase-3 subunit delta'
MNKYLAPLPWQRQQWQQLYRAHQEARLPHALLLLGQAGLGKALLADHFAKTLLCKQPIEEGFACQHCRNCDLVAANTHPDLGYLAPEKLGQGIKIDAIRSLIEKLNRTTQAAYKIVIINPADSLLLAASNALLKSLEEPSDRVLFILITEKIERLLPTIRSRCQVIRFSPPQKALAMPWLASQLPESTALDKLYQLSAGSPLQALAYAQSDYYQFYIDLLNTLSALWHQEIDPVSCASHYLKNDVGQLLTSLLRLTTELIKCQLLRGYVALDPALSRLAKSLTTPFLFEYFDSLIALQTHLHKVTLNAQLMGEALFSCWALRGVKHVS